MIYKPYFSHNKSTNNIFCHEYANSLAERRRTCLGIALACIRLYIAGNQTDSVVYTIVIWRRGYGGKGNQSDPDRRKLVSVAFDEVSASAMRLGSI